MIQRKQTLFLLELVFLGIALLFVPNSSLITPNGSAGIYLLPLASGFSSTGWHMAAMILNACGIAVSLITIFLYTKRSLQIQLCYALLVIWALLGFLFAACPFVQNGNDILSIQNNYSGLVMSVFAVAAAALAARFIRKDMDLIKSADRIR